ncbi:MAG: heparinase II/III family protein [Deltaproteobacteria bacterium]
MRRQLRWSVPVAALLAGLPCASSFALTAKVFPVDSSPAAVADRRKAVEYVMSLPEQDMLRLVPEQSGIYFTDCPNCDAGSQDRGNWEWVPQRPHQIRCKSCGAVYPNNPKYPDNRYISVQSRSGEHRYFYYERPDGYRIFFRAHADYLARGYMAKACRQLAELYWTTKYPKYARRAALILTRFAEVYPGYAYKYDYPFRQKKFSPYTRNRILGVPPYRVSRWSWWAYMGISRDLLKAYDILRFWPGLRNVDRGKARAKIEEDLFAAMVTFVMGFQEIYSNMSPGMWTDFVHAGRVLNRPEWVMEALKRVNIFNSRSFLYDGTWMETSPSYGKQVMGNLTELRDALEGYDPPEGTPPEAVKFIRTGIKKNAAALAALRRADVLMSLPNGPLPTINDTWADETVSKPRHSSSSVLMPGLGLAILGSGYGSHQVYAWLNYTSGRQHKHADALSIGLFANGRELLTDIGYTHTRWRAWTESTMSHNTVSVDGLDSGFDRGHLKNRLRAFVTDGKGFHLAEAESPAAYPGIADRYRRTCVLIGSDSRDAYLIDVFQVSGGDQHDYLLHGPPSDETVARLAGATLHPYGGTLLNRGTSFSYPAGEGESIGRGGGYGFVRNLRRGTSDHEVILDMRIRSQPGVGIRTHLLTDPGTSVYLGDAPRIRPAEGNDNLLSTYRAPFFCARRSGKELLSRFIAVHEPVNGKATIKGIAAREIKGGTLITVDRGRLGRDYFIMAFDKRASLETETRDGQLRFDGAYGFVRVREGRCVEAHLIGGRRLELGDMALLGTLSQHGAIRRVHRGREKHSRGYFEIAETVDPANASTALMVEFPDGTARAYTISWIEKIAKGTRVHVMEDPGYEIEGNTIRLRTYPQRTIQGNEVTYTIPSVSHRYIDDHEKPRRHIVAF